jgi:hypothetical protein
MSMFIIISSSSSTGSIRYQPEWVYNDAQKP